MNSPWQQQAARIRAALADPAALSFDELLVLRDLDGANIRPLQPPPGVQPREAAALLLLFPRDDELWLPLTVRSSRLPTHRGEVSLPGGAVDPTDVDPAATALREANEELGISPFSVEVVGQLTSFYIPPSNFRLTPIVGLSAAEPVLQPNPGEVETAFSVPLSRLLDPATIQEEIWERRGVQMRVPFFMLEGRKVWGATALLLSELVARLRRSG
jgi:8-oxo-dGTP pyrophosphatase MutT (NUDIX family)